MLLFGTFMKRQHYFHVQTPEHSSYDGIAGMEC